MAIHHLANRMLHCLALCLAGWGLPASAAGPDVIDLQLRWHHQFQFAGYYAAVEKGFYREEGLDVRLHAGDPAHQPVSEVLSGRAQYAEGNSEVLYQYLRGKPLVALAAIFQHSPSILLARRDSGIKTAQDLIGKRVMLMNRTEDADFLTMFHNEGVSLAKIDILPSSYDIEDLISGKVDAFNSYSTNEPYFLRQKGIAYNIIDPANYRVDFYSDILFTSRRELREHPERVAAMVRATIRGWHYAMDHPEEIIDLLVNKYRVEKTRDHLAFEAEEMRKLILPNLIDVGHMNRARWRHMADTFVRAGLVKPGYSLDPFIYDTTPRPTPEWVIPAMIAVLAVLMAVLSASYYLLQLNRRLAQTKSTLEESEQRLRLALDAASQGWFDLDVKTGEVSFGDEYARLLGYRPEQFSTSLEEWKASIHPEDRDAVLTRLEECLRGNMPCSMEYRRRSRDGGWIWINSVGKVAERDEQGRPLRMIGIHTDISERKRLESELTRQAHFDYLTGACNRGRFMEKAAQEINRAARHDNDLSVCMMDIDFFKRINDRHGHKLGDAVLRRLVDICRDTLRAEDIIGRIGGEEFAILLPETDRRTATEVAERLRAEIAETSLAVDDGPPVRFTVSIGVASLTPDVANMDALLHEADKALYEAKAAGRNQVRVNARHGRPGGAGEPVCPV